MRILIACTDAGKLRKMKEAVEQQGHEAVAVGTKESLDNILNAGYSIDAIMAEYWMGNFYGHDIIAKVGFTTPALIWGSRNAFCNHVLRMVSFPNATFKRESVEVETLPSHLTELLSVSVAA